MSIRRLEPSRHLTERRQRRAGLLRPLTDEQRIHSEDIDERMDWNTLPLTLYFTTPPYSYYFEPAFREYYRHLNRRYSTDLAMLAADLSSSGYDTLTAASLLESLAERIHATDLTKFDMFVSVMNYLNPWYLQLVEQYFDSLLGLAAFRLQADIGKGLSKKPIGIYEALKKHKWQWAGAFYKPTVRRGIAHDVNLYDPGLFGLPEAHYTDDRGSPEVLTRPDIEAAVFGLLDECLAYSFALRLFLFEHRTAPELAMDLAPEQRPFSTRAYSFTKFSGAPHLPVQSVHRDMIRDQVQIRVECDDETLAADDRDHEILSMLSVAAVWFPEGQTFVLGLKGEDRLPGIVRVAGDDLRAWVRGEVDDEALAGRFDPVMLFPLKPGRSRRPRTEDSSGRRREPVPGMAIITLEDISTGLARRFRCETHGAWQSHDDVRADLPRLLRYIRDQQIHNNDISRKHWGSTKPQYTTGFLYSREKRARDRWTDPSAEYFAGQFDWRDEHANPHHLPSPLAGPAVETLAEGILYRPNLNWPPLSLRIPR